MREHTQRIKDEHLDQRRDFLYRQRGLPEAQVGNPVLDFGIIETEPVSGNQAEQYVELINPHDTAVDISGWRLTQAVDFTFPPGTVIPSERALYVVADKNAFRARTDGLSGGQGLFIVGGWEEKLSEGESLTLTGADGASVRSTLLGAAQSLAGDSNDDGEFNQKDIVLVMQAGKFDRDEPARRTEGDWNGDGRFNQRDIDFVLRAGTYRTGPMAAAADAVFAAKARGGHLDQL